MNIRNLLLSAFALSLSLVAEANTWLTFDTSTKADITYSSTSEYVQIVTTGTDPHITTNSIGADMHFKDVRLEFYYQASADVDHLQLFFLEPESESRSVQFKGLLTKSTEWKFVSINLATYRSKFSWGKQGSILRMDFGGNSGITIKIKGLGIYGHTEVSEATKQSQARAIESYLAADFAAKVTNVEVTQDKVIVSGTTTGSNCRLAGVTAYGNTFEMSDYEDLGELPAGSFEVTVDRYSQIAGFEYDRLLSKWAIIDSNAKLLSHAHYADEVFPIRHAEPGLLKTKKGLGMPSEEYMTEFDDLGLSWVTFNIVLNTLVECTGTAANETFVYGGKTYYLNASTLASLDKTLKKCQEKGIVVAAILLVHPGGGEQEYATALSHPELTSDGLFSMPDVTNIYGTEVYAATIDFLANRYSQSQYGRIHHWIMHNETDQNLVWTNMGKQPQTRYVDTYEKSLRLVSNIVRQYDQNAYVLGSFTSSWNTRTPDTGDAGFPAKNMIDNMLVYSNVEGDYRWGIAAHVYPQSFQKPVFWRDDTEATYSENSGFCTFKNIEVISDWMLRREHYYKGKEKRMLFFSENGVNAIDNSSYYLNVQAAGAAWAWKKIVRNAGVDAALWHNWRDDPTEGGLKLGLRYSNYAPKPAWYVWQAAGTANEDNVFNQYLSVIGINNWEEIHHGVASNGSSSYLLEFDLTSANDCTCSFDDYYQVYSINTTGGDSHMETLPKSFDLSDNSNSLTFEYKLDNDINMEVFISTNGLFYGDRSISVPLKASTDWKRVYINMAPLRKQYGWGDAGTTLRIDFGSAAGNNMKIRHLCMNNGLRQGYDRLSIKADGANQCTVTGEPTTGVTTIVTATGGDPFCYTNELSVNLDDDANTLMFEYQSTANIDDFKAYFVEPAREQRSLSFGNLPAANQWTKVAFNIEQLRKTHGWGYAGDYLRLDPGSQSGVTFKIRNLCINKGEFTSSEDLTLDNVGMNHLCLNRDTDPETSSSFGQDLAYLSWTAYSIGNDPFVRTNPLTKNLNSDATKLYFEYTATTDIEPLELFFLFPESQTRSKQFAGAMPQRSEWTPVIIDIADMRDAYGWGNAGDLLRIDLGDKVGQEVKIRRLKVYDGKTSDVETIKPNGDDSFIVTGTVGGVTIRSNQRQSFAIYNIMGAKLRQIDVEGSTFVPLNAGIYIVNRKKVIVR